MDKTEKAIKLLVQSEGIQNQMNQQTAEILMMLSTQIEDLEKRIEQLEKAEK